MQKRTVHRRCANRIRQKLLGKAGLNQFHKPLDGELLIGPVGDDADAGAAHDTEGENAQKAFGVDSALVALNTNGCFEFIGFLYKESSGTRMKPDLILNDNIFYIHITVHPFTVSQF